MSQLVAVGHRARHVEQHDEVRVRVRLELLHIEAVRLGEQLPVEAARVVAGDIGAVLGEVRGKTEVGRAMQSGDESFDDESRDELEIVNARQHLGVQERAAWNSFGVAGFFDGSGGVAHDS